MTGTLPDDLRAAAAEAPDRLAVADAHVRLSYAELAAQAAGLATGLAALGVRRGDRVAVVMRNSAAAAVALHGALCAGAAVVPLDATAPEVRLLRLLDHCGARAVLCDDVTAPRVQAAAARAACPPHVVVAGEGRAGELRMADLARLPATVPRPLLPVDLAAVVCTSGSTGEPKGATFLHAGVRFVVDAVAASLDLRGDDTVLSLLPVSHTYGLYQLLLAVRVRAGLVLLPGTTPPGRVVQALQDEAVTVLPGVPTLWQVLLSLRGLSDRPLPALRLLTNAGAALPPDRVRQLRRAFPRARLVSMYGQTECARVCTLPAHLVDTRPDSVGVPLPGTEAWVELPDGTHAGVDEVGELVVRGEHVMQGYWRDEHATAQRLVAGRLPGDRVLRTGDLFRRDAEGLLYFVSRSDDVIVTRADKVVPLEVERVLSTAPGVREAAVVGVPDERLGARVVAHVSALPGRVLDPDVLRRHCAEHLEPVKVPRDVVLHADLPRLSNGKVDRLALRGSAPGVDLAVGLAGGGDGGPGAG